MRCAAGLLLLGASVAWSEIRDVVKSPELDRLFAGPPSSRDGLVKNNYGVAFRSVSAPAASEAHRDADEFWFVRSGAAKLSLGARQYNVSAGDVVHVPRTTAWKLAPGPGRFDYAAVLIFPVERRLRIGIGAGPEPRPMPDVATRGQIDATFAAATKNVLLHSAGAVLINHVVYNGTHGPWEVHAACDDLYFVRLGSGRAQLDGRLLNGKEDPPGEIRGTGVTGAREFSVGPGDMVVVPRNTAHFMDPGKGKLGYLLVKICE